MEIHEERIKKILQENKKIVGGFQYLMEDFMQDYGHFFVIAPASTRFHHSYPGGLYDHTLEVLNGVRAMINVFPELDAEVLETGAILHDIGKVFSYELNNPTKTGKIPATKYQRTDEIKDIGDIGETLQLISKYGSYKTKEEYDQLQHIKHLIASHHGEMRRGWGSLIDPKTPEAQTLHFVDMISSRVRTNIPEVDWKPVFEETFPDIFKTKE